MHKFAKSFIFIVIAIKALLPLSVQAQDVDDQYQATVMTIVSAETVDVEGRSGTVQTLKIRFEEGPEAGQVVTLENNNLNDPRQRAYAIGEQIYVSKLTLSDKTKTEDIYTVADEVRQPAIYILFFIFGVLTLLIAGKKGVMSLFGLAFSFLILIFIVLPMFSSGVEPVLVAAVAAFFMVGLNFYFSHGFSWKTTIAVFSTLAALLITVMLSLIFIELGKLTGFASEEAVLLQSVKGELINIKGLILASILIGSIGVLDDITISQTSIVYGLQDVAKHLSFKELYHKAMQIGKDHIASMVNTLVLVYTSGALPLLLLFVNASDSVEKIINLEYVAQEIIITLLSSIGLILAVPITTFLGVYILKRNEQKDEQNSINFTNNAE